MKAKIKKEQPPKQGEDKIQDFIDATAEANYQKGREDVVKELEEYMKQYEGWDGLIRISDVLEIINKLKQP